MNSFEIKIDNYTSLVRVDKSRARKAYNNGLNVYFIPCLCAPLNPWFSLGIWQNKDLDGQYETFDKLVNAFENYNCNPETGRYTAYYLPLAWFDRFTGKKCFDGYYTEHYNHIRGYDLEYIEREVYKHENV